VHVGPQGGARSSASTFLQLRYQLYSEIFNGYAVLERGGGWTAVSARHCSYLIHVTCNLRGFLWRELLYISLSEMWRYDHLNWCDRFLYRKGKSRSSGSSKAVLAAVPLHYNHPFVICVDLWRLSRWYLGAAWNVLQGCRREFKIPPAIS